MVQLTRDVFVIVVILMHIIRNILEKQRFKLWWRKYLKLSIYKSLVTDAKKLNTYEGK